MLICLFIRKFEEIGFQMKILTKKIGIDIIGNIKQHLLKKRSNIISFDH